MKKNTNTLLKFFIPGIIVGAILIGMSELEYRQVVTTTVANTIIVISGILALGYYAYQSFKK